MSPSEARAIAEATAEERCIHARQVSQPAGRVEAARCRLGHRAKGETMQEILAHAEIGLDDIEEMIAEGVSRMAVARPGVAEVGG